MARRLPPPSDRELPDLGKAAQIEGVAPGSGARLIEAYFRSLETDDYERRARVRADIAEASHARVYRHLCLLLGTGLASGAIALGAYGVALGADVYAIAALVGPSRVWPACSSWAAVRRHRRGAAAASITRNRNDSGRLPTA